MAFQPINSGLAALPSTPSPSTHSSYGTSPASESQTPSSGHPPNSYGQRDRIFDDKQRRIGNAIWEEFAEYQENATLEIGRLRSNASVQQNTITNLQTELQSARSTIESVGDSKIGLESKLQTERSTVSGLRGTNSDLHGQLNNANEDNVSLSNDNRKLRKENNNLENRRNSLQRDYDNRGTELGRVKGEKQLLQGQVEKLEEHKQELQEDLNSAREKADQQRQHISYLSENSLEVIAKYTAREEAAEKRLREEQAARTQERVGWNTAKDQEIEQLQSQHQSSLQTETSRLQTEVDEQKAECKIAKDNWTQADLCYNTMKKAKEELEAKANSHASDLQKAGEQLKEAQETAANDSMNAANHLQAKKDALTAKEEAETKSKELERDLETAREETRDANSKLMAANAQISKIIKAIQDKKNRETDWANEVLKGNGNEKRASEVDEDDLPTKKRPCSSRDPRRSKGPSSNARHG